MLFRLLVGTAIPAAAELCVDETCHGTESATLLQVSGRSTSKVGTGQASGLYAATLKLLKEGAEQVEAMARFHICRF